MYKDIIKDGLQRILPGKKLHSNSLWSLHLQGFHIPTLASARGTASEVFSYFKEEYSYYRDLMYDTLNPGNTSIYTF